VVTVPADAEFCILVLLHNRLNFSYTCKDLATAFCESKSLWIAGLCGTQTKFDEYRLWEKM